MEDFRSTRRYMKERDELSRAANRDLDPGDRLHLLRGTGTETLDEKIGQVTGLGAWIERYSFELFIALLIFCFVTFRWDLLFWVILETR